MTDFEMVKMLLEKTGAEIKITIWNELNESLIEDSTNEVDYWFKDDSLDYINNVKQEYVDY